MTAKAAPVVVKLGGSLAEGERQRLSSILQIVGAATRPCVVVPGGGAFADAVRDAHRSHGLTQAVSHRMALLAMHQTGMMLAAMDGRLVCVETLSAIRRALAEGRIPVWMPLKLSADDAHITHDWKTTSDALAARLAERLGRASVVLVKSCPVDPRATAGALSRAGIVDATFPKIVTRAKLDWRVLGVGDEGELAELLGAETRAMPPTASRRRAAPRKK